MRTHGYVHIYCGDGKGKTTAATGLGVRAAGAGKSVIMVQFLKTAPTGELSFLCHAENFRILRFERTHGFVKNLSREALESLKQDLRTAEHEILRLIETRACDLLILDEILDVLMKELTEEETVLTMIRLLPEDMELVLTGRCASERLIGQADYVTEMKKIKHPYDQGVMARKGIEF